MCSKKCIFTDIWVLTSCSTFFLTFWFCNGISKIRQEENILFILTTVYPLNLLKSVCFHYCTKLTDRNVKLGARARRSLRFYFKHIALLSHQAQGPGDGQLPQVQCSLGWHQRKGLEIAIECEKVFLIHPPRGPGSKGTCFPKALKDPASINLTKFSNKGQYCWWRPE